MNLSAQSLFNFHALNYGRKIIFYLISYQLREDLICMKIQEQSFRSGATETRGLCGLWADLCLVMSERVKSAGILFTHHTPPLAVKHVLGLECPPTWAS
jgi:hypothetical protein